MKKYLLGIDIGTSACKIAIFNKQGEVIATGNGDYQVYYPKPGYAEQDPEEWWEAIYNTIYVTLQKAGIEPEEIGGVGVDGQSWSAIAMDKEGKVLTKTPIWMDTRANEICDRLNKEVGEAAIFNLAGNSLQPSYTTAKILWYKEQMPEVYEKTDKILQSNSFIVYRLTDVLSQDKSQGYGLHCFDMHTGTWDEAMCKRLGIPRNLLPEIYDCHQVVGYVTEKAAKLTGLAIGTPVVAGGLDAACGTLGSGVIHPGETQEQGGQAGGMSICLDEYRADPRLILSFHVVPNQWLLQGGTTGGGGVMRWFEKEFADFEREEGKRTGKSSLELLNDIAAKVNPGSDGVVFLPYMAGERSPIWDIHAKGVYYGLDYSKTKGHFVRASMEGVALSLKHNLDIAAAAGAQVKELRAMGGSANSLLWTQIKSDVTGKPIAVPSSDTATTLGAVILAGVGVGMYKDFEEAVEMTVKVRRNHTPNVENQAAYEENYKTYLELYDNLKNTMKERSLSLKAAVVWANEEVRYEEYTEPVTQPGTVKVKVKASGICGSDIPRVLHNGVHFYPIVLGHEFSGDVVEVGEGVTKVQVGDRVSGAPLLPCLTCDDCQNGNYSLCKHYSFIGSREQGSNADYVVIPERNAVVFDKSVSYEQGAMFEPSTVALHGLMQNDYQGGKYVAVLGGGTIGMFTMQWAKIFGSKKVVVFDINDERLALAKRLGADEVVNTTKEGFMETAMEYTGGKGYDFVYETAGAAPTMYMAFELAGNKSHVCFIGTPHVNLEFTPKMWENMNRKEFKLTGSWMSYSAPYPGKEWELTAHYFATGQLKFDPGFIGQKFPMSQAQEAFQLFKTPGAVNGKILLMNED